MAVVIRGLGGASADYMYIRGLAAPEGRSSLRTTKWSGQFIAWQLWFIILLYDSLSAILRSDNGNREHCSLIKTILTNKKLALLNT